MKRDVQTVVRKLIAKEMQRDKGGYPDDATFAAWQRHILVLLSRLVKSRKKSKSTVWQKYVSAESKKGKSLKDIAKEWKLR